MDEPQTISREANILLVRENPTSLDFLLENDPATGFSENLDFCDLLQLQRVDRRISAAVSLITDAKWQKYLQYIKQNRKCIKEIVIGTRYIKSSIDYVAPLIEKILANKIIKEIRTSDTSYTRELEGYESPTSPHLLSIQKIILCIETCALYIPSKNECSHIPTPGFETIKDFVPDFERDCQCVDSIGKLVEAARSLKGDFKLSAKEAHEWLNDKALTQKNLLIKTNAYVEHLPRFVNLKSLIIGDNGTYRIPNEVLELPRLKTLRVLCESVVFPEDFHRLTSLTKLSIDAFPACFWDEGSSRFRVPTIEKFPNLRKLTVTEFGSVTVQDLPSLEEIDYNMGGLKVTRCPRLNHLKVVPNKSIEIDNSSSITSIELMNGDVLCDDIYELIKASLNLQSLTFYSPLIAHRGWKPCQLHALKKLVFFDAPNDPPEPINVTLKKVIGSTPGLEELHVINPIEISCLSSLPCLKVLELQEISMRSMNLPSMTALVNLTLSWRHYGFSISGELEALKSLQFLHLKESHEITSSLALAICRLPNLTELSVERLGYSDPEGRVKISSELLKLYKRPHFRKLRIDCMTKNVPIPNWMWSLPQRITVELDPAVFRDVDAFHRRGWWGYGWLW